MPTGGSLEPIARAVCAHRGLTFGGSVGAGAFKETFLATLPDNPDVAVKVYRPTASPARAAREIEAMVSCNHPNIAKVVDVDNILVEGGTHVYCLEEFLSGGTLGQFVARRGLLPPRDTQRLLLVLAGALGHLAERGLVHRDLKPENIILREDGRTPVIVDFGLVRNLAEPSLTQTWLMHGPCTPLFAPAEQLLNAKPLIDWRADQFSLAVTFSILALGLHPYAETRADAPDAIIRRVADRRHPSILFTEASAAAGLPGALTKMLAPWPVHRYRTPPDLVAALITSEQRD